MAELLGLLIGLLIFCIIAAVIILVGHGGWVLIAMIFGRGRRRKPKRQCVFCSKMTPAAEDRCDWCGRDLGSPLAAEMSDLDALARQLGRFRDKRALKAEVVENLLGRVQRYRQRLFEQPAGRPAAAPDSPFAAQPTPAPPEAPVVAEAVEEPSPRRLPKPAAALAVPAKPPAAEPRPRPAAASPKPPAAEPTPRQAAAPAKPPAARPIPKPQPPAAPPRPVRSWTQLLAAFMEERNIRWGELIGGLLIVGSSVALVLSLWKTLEEHIPYFQFLIFATVLSAIFGVGLYAHYRWKLESTSRGLLIIATLLVPLYFLAIGLSPQQRPALTVVLELASLGVFALLVGLAGRVVVPGGRWLQVLAVLGGSAAVLVAARWVSARPFGGGLEQATTDGRAGGWFLAAGCLPVACFAAAVGGYLYKLSQHRQLDQSRAGALFTLLGTAAFALLVALGLLVHRAGDVVGALDRMSVMVALAALPVLAAGLAVIRGTARDAALAAYHAAGTTVALIGMIAMLAAVGLAWPQPLWIIAVGTLNSAALVLVAFYYRLPILHTGAIASAAVAYLAGFHVIWPGSGLSLSGGPGLGPKMLELTFEASSGTALGGLFVVFGAVAELLARRGRHRHGAMYAGGCGAVAVIGLLLVTWHGLMGSEDYDALRATILYAVYGSGSLALAARWRRAELSYLGLGLLAAAPMWFVWWRTGRIEPVWATVLGAEALAMVVIAAVLQRRSAHQPGTAWRADAGALKSLSLFDVYRVSLLHVAEIVAPMALALGASTAWFDRASIALWPSPWPAATAALLAALYLLLAWGYRSPQRTWVGSMVALVGLVHTLGFNYTEWVEQPWLVALLAHSTLAVVAGVLLDARTKRRSDRGLGDPVRRVFSKPLGDTALLSSALVLPVLPFASLASTWSLALCLFWLAAIWLVIAWTGRDAVVFAAHQAMFATAAVVATTAWLKGQDWVAGLPRDLLRPESLQAYNIVLGLLSLAWVVARILLRGDKVAQQLLSPHGPSVDRIVRHAVVFGQLLLVAGFLLPGVAEELAPQKAAAAAAGVQQATTGVPPAASGLGAWAVVVLMAIVVSVTLWYRWRISMVSSLLLAATIPWLVAGRVADHHVVASTLRWGWATCFVLCSAAVWGRGPLLRASSRAGAKVDVGRAGPAAARATLLVTTALPVLAVTSMAALLQFLSILPAEPPAESFFERIGTNVSYVVPLVLVMLGLVGHAIRERSAAYAFSAGLVAEMIVTLGYVLSVVTGSNARPMGVEEYVMLVQLATITAAAWAGAWLAVRHWLNIWREGPASGSARVLMNVQLGIGAAGNVLLLVPALVTLAVFHPHGQAWTVAAGKPLGWIALVSVVAAYVYRRLETGRRLQPQVVGLLGMAALGLLACSVQGRWDQWGYRTLMLGWAAYSLFIVLATWWVATVRTLPQAQGPPQALIRAAAVWVRVAGILAVVLGIKTAFWNAAFRLQHEELLWAAAAIAVASTAGAAMAVWRRQEGWAFAAALGVNLAASLVVWYFHRRFDGFGQWWLRLVQANVIASSAVALVWLAVRRRLYQLRELTLGESPLLAVQTTLPVIGNFLLLIVPVGWLVLDPSWLPHGMARLAEVPGWLALLFAAAAAAWYLRQVWPGSLLHVLGGLGLGAGVLAACHGAPLPRGSYDNAFFAYHTLLAAWAAAGLILLGIGMLFTNFRLPVRDDGQGVRPDAAGRLVFPAPLVQAWVTAIGLLVVILAVMYSPEDPAGVWWRLRAIFSVSLAAGILAMWLREPAYVFVSGLLLNVLGTVAWMVWGPLTLAGFVHANVVCLAAGSAAWSLLGFAHPAGIPHARFGGRPLPFAHLAARLAVGLIVAIAALAVTRDVLAWGDVQIERLDWIALAAATACVTICLWDRSSRFPLAGLYFLGLAALGTALCARNLGSKGLCWTAAAELPGFVIAAAALGWALRRTGPVWQALRIPDDGDSGRPARWSDRWFRQSQAALAVAAAGLVAWISTDFAFDGVGQGVALFGLDGRPAGVAGALMLLGAAILMAWQSQRAWRRGWQYAALASGALLNGCLGWALLDAAAKAPWLPRSVTLLVATAMMTLLSGLGLGLVLPNRSDWIAAGRRAAPVFGALALVVLAIVLVQEGLLFDPHQGVPLAWPAIAVVTAALAALVAACLALAVVPEWDPLDLSDNQRQGYVYAAEVLAGLVGLHVWLTMPWLFQWGLVHRYWMLIMMAVAFAGAGLSEWFHRRNMPVLSKPLERTALLLPLAPAVGYWLMQPTGSASWFLGDASPAMWFLMGLFYAVLAIHRRSIFLAVLGLAAGNVGLSALWLLKQWYIQDHPQLWLIPVGLALLVAERLDRSRLNESQRASLRYLALGVIYVSSTIEFWRGIGESVWLPLVLVGLSVAGVLAGVLLRIRSFLILGSIFLTFVIGRMIVYAAFEQGRVWIFWTCCIFLGLAILALVAVFEKRRNDVLAAVERLKDWER